MEEKNKDNEKDIVYNRTIELKKMLEELRKSESDKNEEEER